MQESRIKHVDFIEMLEDEQTMKLEIQILNCNKKINDRKKTTTDASFVKNLLKAFDDCFDNEKGSEENVKTITELLKLEEYETYFNEKKEVNVTITCNNDSCKDCSLFMSCGEFDKNLKKDLVSFYIGKSFFELKTENYITKNSLLSRHSLNWNTERFFGYLQYFLSKEI